MYAARPGGRALQPSTSYHLLNRARRRYEIAVAIIFANPGPSGPEETAESHSDFARRKFSTDLQVRVPRNGGPGVSRHWRTKFASAASPGDPLGTFPSLGKYLAARRRRNLPAKKRNRSIIAPSSVTASPCHLPPKGKAFKGSPLIRPLRGHLSLSPLSLRDISP